MRRLWGGSFPARGEGENFKGNKGLRLFRGGWGIGGVICGLRMGMFPTEGLGVLMEGRFHVYVSINSPASPSSPYSAYVVEYAC